jgi:hypothetical protein
LAIAATVVTRELLNRSLYSSVRLSGRLWSTSSRTRASVTSATGHRNNEVTVVTFKDGMMKLGDLRTSEDALAGALCDFRAEWERTAVARALASQVVAYRVKHGL